MSVSRDASLVCQAYRCQVRIKRNLTPRSSRTLAASRYVLHLPSFTLVPRVSLLPSQHSPPSSVGGAGGGRRAAGLSTILSSRPGFATCHVRSTLRFSADQSWAVGWQSLGTLVEAQRYGSHGRQSTVEMSGQRVVWLLPFSLTSLSTGFVDVLAYVPLAQALSMHTPRRVVACAKRFTPHPEATISPQFVEHHYCSQDSLLRRSQESGPVL